MAAPSPRPGRASFPGPSEVLSQTGNDDGDDDEEDEDKVRALFN